MSYTSIPNQPIIFDSQLPEQCDGCNKDYAQLMDFNDQVFWQLEAGECSQLRFRDSIGVSVTIEDTNITFPDVSNAFAVFVYDKFVNCLDYRVSITIAAGATGTLVIGFLNGSFVEVSAVGTHTIYVKENAIPNVLNSPQVPLAIVSKPTDKFVGQVTLNEFVPICNGALFAGIVDAQDLSVVQVLDPTIITKDQYLTAAIDLSDYELEAGCYRLAIADFCTNTCGQYYMYNPYFNDWGLCIGCPPVGWVNVYDIGTSNWIVGNGQAQIIFNNGLEVTILESIIEVCEGKEYSITIVVDSINDCILRLWIDGSQYLTSINSAGTYTANIIPTSSGKISLRGSSIIAGGDIVVSQVQLRAYKEWATYDKYSDLITIGDYSDPCRFFKIEGCNGEDQFGLSFYGSSFLPSIRLEGRRFQAQYETDADLFRYSSGRWSSTYVDRKKKVSFYFGRLPEYVFDFLSIVVFFDNCYINGILHSPVDSEFPTIEYETADDLGAITIDMFKQNDLVRKTICIGVTADCLPSILDNQDEPFILTEDNERILTENLINLYQE